MPYAMERSLSNVGGVTAIFMKTPSCFRAVNALLLHQSRQEISVTDCVKGVIEIVGERTTLTKFRD